MLLLFDTSTTTAVVALSGPDGTPVIGERTFPRSEGGSSLLLRGTSDLLSGAGLDIRAVTGVVVNRGPGSYTGLRVGHALAQGLVESRGVAVASIPSFKAFASQYRDDSMALCVCYDARSRGIAWITYLQGEEEPLCAVEGEKSLPRAAPGREILELGDERVLLQMAAAPAVPGLIPRPCRLVGPGLGSLRKRLDHDLPADLFLVKGSERAAPEHLLQLGAQVLLFSSDDPVETLPYYLGTMEAPQFRSRR